jgi:hypothetical protein
MMVKPTSYRPSRLVEWWGRRDLQRPTDYRMTRRRHSTDSSALVLGVSPVPSSLLAQIPRGFASSQASLEPSTSTG